MKLSHTRFIFIALIASLLLHSCKNNGKNSMATNGKEEFSDSAVSSISVYKDGQGRRIMQKTNTSYDVMEFTDKQDLKKLLLKVTKAETSYIDSGASENHFKVSVSGIGDTKVNWSKDMQGTDLDYTYKVLVVHTEGKTSDQEDTYTQYSLQTGDKLMTYTYSPLMAQIINTSNKRFFGYLSKQSSTADKPEQYATVSYTGSNELIDKINIKLKDTTGLPAYTPEIGLLAVQGSGNTVAAEGKIIILSHTDRTFTAEQITDFAMQITYAMPEGHAPISILLPIKNDHVDLASATYDKSIFEITKAN